MSIELLPAVLIQCFLCFFSFLNLVFGNLSLNTSNAINLFFDFPNIFLNIENLAKDVPLNTPHSTIDPFNFFILLKIS